MKSTFPSLVGLVFALFSPLGATPDRRVIVEEELSGSNENAFAVLRTERDNLGSYYDSQRRVTLEERSKETGEVLKSTLLLDVKASVDSDHNDPKTPPPVRKEILTKDDTVTLADLLERFPPPARQIWDEAKLAKLETDPTAGIYFDRRIQVADGKQITEEVFQGRLPEEAWKIAGVFEDANSIYFKLSKIEDNGDGSNEFRILSASPALTKSIRAHQNRQPFYLVAGTFATEEEAVKQAEAWLAKAREAKNYHFTPEVWSKREPTDRVVYVVVEPQSMGLIESGKLKELTELLGTPFIPESSHTFQERIIDR